jgi:FkbM family methyltransferase
MRPVLAATLRPLLFRGKERLANLITPTCGVQTATIFGARFDLDMSDFIQRNMYAGSFEYREARVVRQMLLSGMTFVDVGANVGFYTALAAEAVGRRGTFIAFEPSEYAFPRLRRMIASNSLNQVRALKCGLGEAPGTTILYGGVETDSFNNHTATMVPHDNPNRNMVEIETLDRMALRLKLHRIDFLKIDVDGYEAQVLRGAGELLRNRRISNILLECSDYWLSKMKTTTTELLDQLTCAGFTRITRIGGSENYLASL